MKWNKNEHFVNIQSFKKRERLRNMNNLCSLICVFMFPRVHCISNKVQLPDSFRLIFILLSTDGGCLSLIDLSRIFPGTKIYAHVVVLLVDIKIEVLNCLNKFFEVILLATRAGNSKLPYGTWIHRKKHFLDKR